MERIKVDTPMVDFMKMAEAHATSELRKDRFEYMVIEFNTPDVKSLNKWGQEKWEVCGVWNGVYIIFKRKIK